MRWSVLALLLAAPALAAPPTPDSFLGHRVGADRKLADWGQISGYFDALDRESDRVVVERIGESTLGRDLLMAVISSPDNLRQLDRYKAIARRLADARGSNGAAMPTAEAEGLIAEGKAIVLVTCNIHSTEIGSSQMAMEWAYDLATSEDPRVRRWLDDVILLLMPSINPDGTDIVVDWYRKWLGTPYEGGRLPWLYHHYAGHDNNRDWYMLNLDETRHVNRVLHHQWFPQVFLDEHQMGATGPRIFVPPYADPHTSLVHPLQWRLNDLVGTHMALRLEEAGKSGVIDSYAYDAYWPGGTKNTACLKNVIGLLTEVASCRVATPVEVDPSELSGGRKGLPDYQAQMNFPNPWPGGRWSLRNIVDYELLASNALLETCSTYRAEILRACYAMARDAIERGTRESPRAYVVPPGQRDPSAAARMVAILRENGLEAHRTTADAVTPEGRIVPRGSTVFFAAQPYRSFLIEMMERQRYPEVRQGPDTKAIFRPYDVTAWTLPLLMGVEWFRTDGLDVAVEPVEGDLELPELKPDASVAEYVLSAGDAGVHALVHAVLAAKVPVERIARDTVAGTGDAAVSIGAGDFVVAGRDGATLARTYRDHPATGVTLAEKAPGARLAVRAPRVGLYKPWVASMDEGWTRMVLERNGFASTALDNAAIKKGKLKSRYDAIVLPDLEKAVIIDGRPKEDPPRYFEPLPPPYQGGIGKEGVAALKAFVEEGGTLVCLTSSSALAIEELNVPVRDLARGKKPEEFSLPGTLVNLEVDPAHPLAFGLGKQAVAYVTGGPVFETSVPGGSGGRAVVARYPAHADQVVASGWGDGLALMEGKGAVVECRLGKGRVVLFGPRVQHRGQTVATFPLLFNALWSSVAP